MPFLIDLFNVSEPSFLRFHIEASTNEPTSVFKSTSQLYRKTCYTIATFSSFLL